MKNGFCIILLLFTFGYVHGQNTCPYAATAEVLDSLTYAFDIDNLDTTAGQFTFLWTFGDGQSSTTQAPVYSYPGNGIFDVCVEITDSMNNVCMDCMQVVVPITNQNLVWPGDINNSGKANNIDLLFLGNVANFNGPLRFEMSTDWSPHFVLQPWIQTFPNGVDQGFADCDGDGIVDSLDVIAIADNYGKTHGQVFPDTFSFGQIGQHPSLSVQPPMDTITAGASFEVNINLGDQVLQNTNVYGIAFSVLFEPDYVISDSIQFTPSQFSWFNQNGADAIYTIAESQEPGRFDVAVTRDNHISVAGFGTIGKMSIVMEDNISGLQQGESLDLNFTVTDVVVVDEFLNYHSVASESWEGNLVLSAEFPSIADDINLFPNPTSGNVMISSGDHLISGIKVFNSIGQKVLSGTYGPRNQVDLNLSNQSPGLYLISLRIRDEWVAKKVLLR